jgi:hypothetical protein
MNQPEPIHLIAKILEILPVVEMPNGHQRQQLLLELPNGNTYKFFLSSEPWLTAKGSYINNIAAYSIHKQ